MAHRPAPRGSKNDQDSGSEMPIGRYDIKDMPEELMTCHNGRHTINGWVDNTYEVHVAQDPDSEVKRVMITRKGDGAKKSLSCLDAEESLLSICNDRIRGWELP